MIWWICLSIVVLQLLLAILLKFALVLADNSGIDDKINNKISVIIPFHNETNWISGLINSLNNSTISDSFEFIFVDDYSTDATNEIIVNGLKVPCQILKNTGSKGKKHAIRVGIENAKNDIILTWDADISFDSDYLKNIQHLKLHDMDLLPVRMESDTLIGKLSCIEFTFLESLGQGLGSLGYPTIANGANLIFKKSLFLELDGKRTDYDIPSGDDLFLLNAFQNNKAKIHQYNNSELAVATEAPSTFSAVLLQRKRWISKMKSLISVNTILGLLILVLVQVAFVIALVMSFISPYYLIIIGIKLSAELIITAQFLKRHWIHLLILILHQIWYPLYSVALIISRQKDDKWSA